MLSCTLCATLRSTDKFWKRFSASSYVEPSGGVSIARIMCEERTEGGVPESRCVLKATQSVSTCTFCAASTYCTRGFRSSGYCARDAARAAVDCT